MLKQFLILCLFMPAVAQAQGLCPRSNTTVEMNQCLNIKLERAIKELDNNLDLIRLRYAKKPAMIETIEQAQASWETYRKKQCQSVFLLYKHASIQSLMTVSCSIQLARERNQLLRQTYLDGR